MTRTSAHDLFRALHLAGVRFLVVGGLAVNAYGLLRYTKDIDLVLDLEAANVRRGFAAFAALGYSPTVPVTAEEFADAATRHAWIRDKHMRVLQLWSDRHRDTPVDLFVEEPFPFADEYERAREMGLPGAGTVRFVSLRTLIAMKEAAGRVQDRVDLEHLRRKLSDDEAT